MKASQENTHPFAINIERRELNQLELGQYEGPINVISNANLLQGVVEEIISEKQIGFDTESKPVFVKGVYNHVALIQIALPKKVYLLRTNQMGIPSELKLVLENPQIKKIGLALSNDLVDLKKLRHFKPAGFIDLQPVTKQIGIKAQGLRKLCGILLGFRISKSAQVSNWEAPTLSEKQLRYAATDAWACLEMYHKLKAHNIPFSEMH